MKSLASIPVVMMALALTACGHSPPPRQPPGQPPAPPTVTVTNPGGDAEDPELAALQRLKAEPWRARRDIPNTLVIPLVDAPHWRRVKLWGQPSRVTFRFGDEHYGIVSVFYEQVEGPSDPESCLDRFAEKGREKADVLGVTLAPGPRTKLTQATPAGPRLLVIQTVDAKVESLLSKQDWAGAVASYSSWPGTCLIAGMVVVATKHPVLADEIRKRWVAEGAPKLVWNRRVTVAPAIQSF